MARPLLSTALLLALATPALAASDDLAGLARVAVGDTAAAPSAIAALRARGPSGLDALLTTHAAPLARARDARSPDAGQRRLLDAVDAVAAQHLAAWSGLYWYTDLAAAQAAARASSRPILSLRLLGRLDEEMSCANSRFFRTLLYADPAVARVLRERFVLHWESVRKAPRITVDFGDGRRIERTITGNSIHYVLDADARVVDALPGLYAPGVFLERLKGAEAAVREAAAAAGTGRREEVLRTWHRTEAEGVRVAAAPERRALPALRADGVALSKSAVERPLVTALAESTVLSAPSVALVRRSRTGGEADRTLARLRADVARDTIANEVRHARLHAWLAEARTPEDRAVAPFNERVYAEMFLTPSSDPWLGLVTADAYTGLDGPDPAGHPAP